MDAETQKLEDGFKGAIQQLSAIPPQMIKFTKPMFKTQIRAGMADMVRKLRDKGEEVTADKMLSEYEKVPSFYPLLTMLFITKDEFVGWINKAVK